MTSIQSVTLDELASSFDNKGFDLFMEERIESSISVEETIIAALIKKQPRLIEGIPTLITKNNINYDYLTSLVDNYKLWNEFGYFGEFAANHLNEKKLNKLVEYCHNKLKPQANLYDYDLFKKFQKEEEKKWNLTGAPSYDSMKKQFKRYCNGKEIYKI